MRLYLLFLSFTLVLSCSKNIDNYPDNSVVITSEKEIISEQLSQAQNESEEARLTLGELELKGQELSGNSPEKDRNKLSKQLIDAGENVEEKVWRMPLNKNFDKLIDSKNADMQNINYVGGAGSTTAAQFLQRFILNKTPWAHLDIAGMAFSKYGGALNSGGATGYGVRLLNKLIEDHYE